MISVSHSIAANRIALVTCIALFLVVMPVVLALRFTPGTSGGMSKPAEPLARSLQGTEDQEIQRIVREYLLNQPEVIVEAVRELERRQQRAEQDRQRESLLTHTAALNDTSFVGALGNPEGDIAIIEFFDYNCGFCKRVMGPLRETIEEDGKIKLVMREFPILGATSVYAARAALAAAKQDKYEEMHWALMELRGGFSEETVLATAENLGLDVEKLKADMESEEVEAEISSNHALANALSIQGTPAFVIGTRLVPGAITAREFRAIIAQERAKQG